MAIQTFEYCSLVYLNQWLAYDRSYCQALSKGDNSTKLTALKNAGGFYGVARNLPREFDEKKGIARYQPVLEILDKVDPDLFQVNVVEEILKIKRKISEKYGKRNVLSWFFVIRSGINQFDVS